LQKYTGSIAEIYCTVVLLKYTVVLRKYTEVVPKVSAKPAVPIPDSARRISIFMRLHIRFRLRWLRLRNVVYNPFTGGIYYDQGVRLLGRSVQIAFTAMAVLLYTVPVVFFNQIERETAVVQIKSK
jgi:hypothetical protein